jgi:NAD(P)-dependent dehydrogenase (short-subunit alcohol dehydrogenase family)
VLATARSPALSLPINATGNASQLWSLTGTPNGRNLTVLECDVSDEKSISAFAKQVKKLGRIGGVLEKGKIDVVVLNAGVLVYPNRISEMQVNTLSLLLLGYESRRRIPYMTLKSHVDPPFITHVAD